MQLHYIITVKASKGIMPPIVTTISTRASDEASAIDNVKRYINNNGCRPLAIMNVEVV